MYFEVKPRLSVISHGRLTPAFSFHIDPSPLLIFPQAMILECVPESIPVVDFPYGNKKFENLNFSRILQNEQQGYIPNFIYYNNNTKNTWKCNIFWFCYFRNNSWKMAFFDVLKCNFFFIKVSIRIIFWR